MTEEEQFIHDLTNKVIAVSGKLKRIKKRGGNDSVEDIEKADRNADEAIKIIKRYKETMENKVPE